MALPTDRNNLAQARKALEEQGVVAASLLDGRIAASWRRCLANGLDPMAAPGREAVARAELRQLLEENQRLLSLADVEMRSLQSQIAGSDFVILFADPRGVVLSSLLDESLGSARLDFEPGNVWSERIRGTNAVGEALEGGTVSSVHGPEHFFGIYRDITCAAAPVCDPEGRLLAVLDASSNCKARQLHTMALVRMSCLTMENCLFRERFAHKLVLTLHNRHEFLSTLQAGLLAFDVDGGKDGTLLAANRAARFLLQGIRLEPGTPFERIFRQDLSRVLDSLRHARHEFLDDVTGSAFAVKALTAPKRLWATAGRATGQAGAAGGVKPAMVAEDPRVREALRLAERAVDLGSPLLIQGATGTGKELLARHAHAAGGRGGRFVAVNCAALPETLVEAELFGYRGGSFTGARGAGAPGLAQRADKGTLFLDEVGELPLALQAKLLRFLDSGQVRPLGAEEDEPLDVQIIAATNGNLEQAVRDGGFRADLYYRINTVTVALPLLREREDLAQVTRALLQALPNTPCLDAGAMQALAGHPWPGNVRELKGALTRLLLRVAGPVATAGDVRAVLGTAFDPAPAREDFRPQAGQSLHDHERDIARAALARHKGNVSAAARELGISRNKVYALIKDRDESAP